MPALQKQTQALESELQSLKMAALGEAKYLQLAENLAGFRSKRRVRAAALDIECATTSPTLVGEGSAGRQRHSNAATFDPYIRSRGQGRAAHWYRSVPLPDQRRIQLSWEDRRFEEPSWRLVRESFAKKPVGKPDAGNAHMRFDARGWETGRRSGVSAHAHPRLYTSLYSTLHSIESFASRPVGTPLASGSLA